MNENKKGEKEMINQMKEARERVKADFEDAQKIANDTYKKGMKAESVEIKNEYISLYKYWQGKQDGLKVAIEVLSYLDGLNS